MTVVFEYSMSCHVEESTDLIFGIPEGKTSCKAADSWYKGRTFWKSDCLNLEKGIIWSNEYCNTENACEYKTVF